MPAQDLASPGASPGIPAPASPTASPAPGPSDDWEQVPGGTEASPQGAIGDGAANVSPAPGTGESAATPESQTANAPVTPNPPPPALDASTINPGPDLATVSLDPEVKKAPTPALAASLRLTEEARRELDGGQNDDALRDLGRAVSIDPANPFEYFYLGRTYLLKKNSQQALTFFKRAEIGFASRPEWLGETIGFEGVCLEELGRMSDAAQEYHRALTAAPNNLMARVGYGRLAASAGPVGNLDAPPPPVSSAAPAPYEAAPPPPPRKGEALLHQPIERRLRSGAFVATSTPIRQGLKYPLAVQGSLR